MANSRKLSKFFETRYFGLVIGVFVVAVFLVLSLTSDVFTTVELKMLDMYFAYRNVVDRENIQEGVSLETQNIDISPDILLIGIDFRSLDTLGKWPFPRYRHANIMDNFARIKDQTQRERALFIDVFFIEPDSKAYDDVLLIEAIRNNGRVFLETFVDEVPPPAASEEDYFRRQEILYEGWGDVRNIEGPWEYITPYFGLQPPLQPYAAATYGYGHANFRQDVDGIYRRQPLVIKSSRLAEEIRLEDLSADTVLNLDNFERLEWEDKNGTHRHISYPLTEKSLLDLVNQMARSAPLRIIDSDNDGEPDDEYYIVRKYVDRFIPSITLSLALDYFNKTIEDVEVVLGEHVLIKSPQYYDVENDQWVPYELVIEPAVFDENGELVTPAETELVPEIRIPVDEQGTMLVNYMGKPSFSTPGAYQTFPVRSYSGYASSVTSTDPNQWPRTRAVANKILMIGPFARGMAADQKQTPYGLMYGVEIHANALNTILMTNFLVEVPNWVDYVILAALVLLIALMASRLSTIWSLVVAIVLVFALFITTSVIFDQSAVIVGFAAPAIGVLFTFLAVVVYRVMTEEKDKRRIKDMFGKYVSDKVVDQILENPPELGGVDKDLTVFFSDIRGFTSLSEAMPPQELVNHLNLYLTAMTDLIMEYQGTLDKYVGDEIMCFWGAPIPQAYHALLACRCALKQMEKLAELNEGWPVERRIRIGIGVNSGIMTVGNMGSMGRMDYTLIGDNVNLGARLEGTNKIYVRSPTDHYSCIIISENTYGLVKDKVIVRELDNMRVQGKAKPVTIYELIDMVDGLEPTQEEFAETAAVQSEKPSKSPEPATV
jgi:adenylate cyclase